jgi:hypothetical protein
MEPSARISKQLGAECREAKGVCRCSCDDWHVIVAGFSGDAVSCKIAPREGRPILIHSAGHEKK